MMRPMQDGPAAPSCMEAVGAHLQTYPASCWTQKDPLLTPAAPLCREAVCTAGAALPAQSWQTACSPAEARIPTVQLRCATSALGTALLVCL